MTGERRYDDREVGQILKRVAELHEREGDKADARAMLKASTAGDQYSLSGFITSISDLRPE
jgi:hypothetical protein